MAASNDSGYAVVASPDGTRAYVTGPSHGNGTGFDYATIDYRPAGAADVPLALAVDPKGARVYATGRNVGTNSGADFATIAYQA